jgi:hypothetical protein
VFWVLEAEALEVAGALASFFLRCVLLLPRLAGALADEIAFAAIGAAFLYTAHAAGAFEHAATTVVGLRTFALAARISALWRFLLATVAVDLDAGETVLGIEAGDFRGGVGDLSGAAGRGQQKKWCNN